VKVTIEMEIADWGKAGVVEIIRRLGKVTAHLWRNKGAVSCFLIEDEAGNTLADVSVWFVLTRDARVTPTAEALNEFFKRKAARERGLSMSCVIPLAAWRLDDAERVLVPLRRKG
jgi:hypothetical protein